MGTAGHIDHGKTSLVKALTGINTDRLKEEQLRGITIELGFAAMDLPSGRHIGIVDVPGHERFVKNMVAGATGIDVVAMVIAADEGVMPQTREHLEICSLLDVRYGMVVLTKIDLVDEEWLGMVTEDIRDFVQGTFLEGQPVIGVSSVTGKGIPEFIGILDQLTLHITERPSSGIFRLPIDRIFTMKGFGTVITGTLVSGEVHAGDTVMIYPQQIEAKVRGLQVHNQNVDVASAGLRTAVNFQGLDKTVIERGDVLSHPGHLQPSYMVDVSFQYLKSNKKNLKNRSAVRFHTGTSEVIGNIIFLDRNELLPGQKVFAQLRLDTPVALVRGDRFVVRSYSPVRTIGGGPIINPIPPKHKRQKIDLPNHEKRLSEEKDPEKMIAFHAETAGCAGISFSQLRIVTNLAEKVLHHSISSLLSRQILVQTDKEKKKYVHHLTFEALKGDIIDNLHRYHLENPLKSGMSKEELKSKYPPYTGAKLLHQAIYQLIESGAMIQEGDAVRMASHRVSLKADQMLLRDKLLDCYKAGGLTPPSFKELCGELGIAPQLVKDVLMRLVEEGRLIKIKEDLFLFSEHLHDLKARIVHYLNENKEMSAPQFKEIANVSRKYLIPLLEYFDSKNVTIRIGDIRRLRSG